MTLTRVIEGRRCRRRRNETEGRKEGRTEGGKGGRLRNFSGATHTTVNTVKAMMFFHAAIGYRWKSSNQRERARGCGFWRQSFLFFESCNECKSVSALHIPMQLYIYLYEYFHRQFAFALKPLLMCIFDEDASGRLFLSFHYLFFQFGLSLLSVLWDFSPELETFMRQLAINIDPSFF